MNNKKQKGVIFLSKNRLAIQIFFGLLIFVIVSLFELSLWWLVLFGTLTGILFGKVFCRWMCPVGIIMELIIKITPNDSFRNIYQYHKIGCPIAWITGLLNKFSLYKIQIDTNTCTNCGLCDKACYMPSLEKQRFSLHLTKKENPGLNYSCSKCMKCVEYCPNGSLTYKPDFKLKYKTMFNK